MVEMLIGESEARNADDSMVEILGIPTVYEFTPQMLRLLR